MIKVLFCFFLLVTSVSADELLNLSQRPEGDTTLGQNVVVTVDEMTGEKYVKVNSHSLSSVGSMVFPLTTTEFDIQIKYQVTEYDEWFTLKLKNTEGVVFRLYIKTFYRDENSTARFTLDAMKSGSVVDSVQQDVMLSKVNTLRVSRSGQVVRVFLNELFVEKVNTISNDYTQVVLDEIHTPYRIFEVSVSHVINQLPAECVIASFDMTTGVLYIPKVQVGNTYYNVVLNQMPGSFIFNLNLEQLLEVKVK